MKTNIRENLEARLAEAERWNGAPKEYVEKLRTFLFGEDGETPFRLEMEGSDPEAHFVPMRVNLKKMDDSTRFRKPWVKMLNAEQKSWLEMELERMLKANIIERSDSQSEWLSSWMLVPKKTKGQYRLVLDSSWLSEFVHEQKTQMPTLREMRQSLGGFTDVNGLRVGASQVFSSVDIVKAYWTVPIRAKDRKFFAFAPGHPHPTYRFKRASMGFINSGTHFVQQMAQKLQDMILERRIIIGVDDILITGREREGFSHTEDLLHNTITLIKRMKAVGVGISPKAGSATFFAKSIDWCGFEIGSGGRISVSRTRIDGLLKLQQPRTVADIIQLHGGASWFRENIPNFSQVFKPLIDFKTKAMEPFKKKTKNRAKRLILKNLGWDHNLEAAWGRCLEAIAAAIPVYAYDEERELVLMSDSSTFAYGGFLADISEDEVDKDLDEWRGLRPLSFLSGIYTGAETRYNIVEKESLSALRSLEKSKSIIGSRKVRLLTDCRNLTYLFSRRRRGSANCVRERRIDSWRKEFGSFNVRIEHVEGAKNKFADLLSRMRYEVEEITPRLRRLTSVVDTNGHIYARVPVEKLSHEIVRVDQEKITDSEKSVNNLHQNDEGLWTNDKDEIFLSQNSDLRVTYLALAHQGISGHNGARTTEERLQGYVNWASRGRDVKSFVNGCISCMLHRDGKRVPRPLSQSIIPKAPGEVLSADYLYMTESKEGFRWLLVIKDSFTRELLLVPTARADAYTAAKGLMRWMGNHAISSKVRYFISDGGSAFRSETLKILHEVFQFHPHITTPHHSQSHGSIERANRVILRAYRRLLHELGRGSEMWPSLVEMITYAVNRAPRAILGGRSPLHVSTGIKTVEQMTLPCLVPFGEKGGNVEVVDYSTRVKHHLSEIRREFDELHELVRENTTKRYLSNESIAARKARAAHFEVGEYVLVAVPDGRDGKFGRSWTGPWVVKEHVTTSDLVYKVLMQRAPGDTRPAVERTVHACRMIPFRGKDFQLTSHANRILWEDMTLHVSSINRVIWDRRKRKFMIGVRWTGFDPQDDTDEPLEAIYPQVPGMVEDFLRVGKQKLSLDRQRALEKQLKRLRKEVTKTKIAGDADPMVGLSVTTEEDGVGVYGSSIHHDLVEQMVSNLEDSDNEPDEMVSGESGLATSLGEPETSVGRTNDGPPAKRRCHRLPGSGRE